MSQVIIVCADDFAQTEAIDQAILSLILSGRLTATSCLTYSPRWPKAAASITPQVRELAAIGLHLDFTAFANYKMRLPKLIAMSYTRQLSLNAVEASIHAQLDAFEEALNSPPDYVDGHQHVHQLPQIRNALISILKQRYPHKTPWLRVAKPPLQDGFKALVIGMLGSQALMQLARQNDIEFSQSLLGVYAFDEALSQYQIKIKKWFELACADKLKAPIVLMCHPSLANNAQTMPTDLSQDSIYSARIMEYQYFSSDSFKQSLDAFGIKLVKYLSA